MPRHRKKSLSRAPYLHLPTAAFYSFFLSRLASYFLQRYQERYASAPSSGLLSSASIYRLQASRVCHASHRRSHHRPLWNTCKYWAPWDQTDICDYIRQKQRGIMFRQACKIKINKIKTTNSLLHVRSRLCWKRSALIKIPVVHTHSATKSSS